MIWRRASHTAWRSLGEETVVLDLRSKHFYGLNAMGGFLWHHLQGALDEVDLAGRLEEADHGLSLEAIHDFLEELRGLDLVEPAGEKNPDDEDKPVTPPLPLGPEAEPPRILWSEEIRAIGQSCAFVSGQSALCNQTPFQ